MDARTLYRLGTAGAGVPHLRKRSSIALNPSLSAPFAAILRQKIATQRSTSPIAPPLRNTASFATATSLPGIHEQIPNSPQLATGSHLPSNSSIQTAVEPSISKAADPPRTTNVPPTPTTPASDTFPHPPATLLQRSTSPHPNHFSAHNPPVALASPPPTDATSPSALSPDTENQGSANHKLAASLQKSDTLASPMDPNSLHLPNAHSTQQHQTSTSPKIAAATTLTTRPLPQYARPLWLRAVIPGEFTLPQHLQDMLHITEQPSPSSTLAKRLTFYFQRFPVQPLSSLAPAARTLRELLILLHTYNAQDIEIAFHLPNAPQVLLFRSASAEQTVVQLTDFFTRTLRFAQLPHILERSNVSAAATQHNRSLQPPNAYFARGKHLQLWGQKKLNQFLDSQTRRKANLSPSANPKAIISFTHNKPHFLSTKTSRHTKAPQDRSTAQALQHHFSTLLKTLSSPLQHHILQKQHRANSQSSSENTLRTYHQIQHLVNTRSSNFAETHGNKIPAPETLLSAAVNTGTHRHWQKLRRPIRRQHHTAPTPAQHSQSLLWEILFAQKTSSPVTKSSTFIGKGVQAHGTSATSPVTKNFAFSSTAVLQHFSSPQPFATQPRIASSPFESTPHASLQTSLTQPQTLFARRFKLQRRSFRDVVTPSGGNKAELRAATGKSAHLLRPNIPSALHTLHSNPPSSQHPVALQSPTAFSDRPLNQLSQPAIKQTPLLPPPIETFHRSFTNTIPLSTEKLLPNNAAIEATIPQFHRMRDAAEQYPTRLQHLSTLSIRRSNGTALQDQEPPQQFLERSTIRALISKRIRSATPVRPFSPHRQFRILRHSSKITPAPTRLRSPRSSSPQRSASFPATPPQFPTFRSLHQSSAPTDKTLRGSTKHSAPIFFHPRTAQRLPTNAATQQQFSHFPARQIATRAHLRHPVPSAHQAVGSTGKVLHTPNTQQSSYATQPPSSAEKNGTHIASPTVKLSKRKLQRSTARSRIPLQHPSFWQHSVRQHPGSAAPLHPSTHHRATAKQLLPLLSAAPSASEEHSQQTRILQQRVPHTHQRFLSTSLPPSQRTQNTAPLLQASFSLNTGRTTSFASTATPQISPQPDGITASTHAATATNTSILFTKRTFRVTPPDTSWSVHPDTVAPFPAAALTAPRTDRRSHRVEFQRGEVNWRRRPPALRSQQPIAAASPSLAPAAGSRALRMPFPALPFADVPPVALYNRAVRKTPLLSNSKATLFPAKSKHLTDSAPYRNASPTTPALRPTPARSNGRATTTRRQIFAHLSRTSRSSALQLPQQRTRDTSAATLLPKSTLPRSITLPDAIQPLPSPQPRHFPPTAPATSGQETAKPRIAKQKNPQSHSPEIPDHQKALYPSTSNPSTRSNAFKILTAPLPAKAQKFLRLQKPHGHSLITNAQQLTPSNFTKLPASQFATAQRQHSHSHSHPVGIFHRPVFLSSKGPFGLVRAVQHFGYLGEGKQRQPQSISEHNLREASGSGQLQSGKQPSTLYRSIREAQPILPSSLMRHRSLPHIPRSAPTATTPHTLPSASVPHHSLRHHQHHIQRLSDRHTIQQLTNVKTKHNTATPATFSRQRPVHPSTPSLLYHWSTAIATSRTLHIPQRRPLSASPAPYSLQLGAHPRSATSPEHRNRGTTAPSLLASHQSRANTPHLQKHYQSARLTRDRFAAIEPAASQKDSVPPLSRPPHSPYSESLRKVQATRSNNAAALQYTNQRVAPSAAAARATRTIYFGTSQRLTDPATTTHVHHFKNAPQRSLSPRTPVATPTLPASTRRASHTTLRSLEPLRHLHAPAANIDHGTLRRYRESSLHHPLRSAAQQAGRATRATITIPIPAQPRILIPATFSATTSRRPLGAVPTSPSSFQHTLTDTSAIRPDGSEKVAASFQYVATDTAATLSGAKGQNPVAAETPLATPRAPSPTQPITIQSPTITIDAATPSIAIASPTIQQHTPVPIQIQTPNIISLESTVHTPSGSSNIAPPSATPPPLHRDSVPPSPTPGYGNGAVPPSHSLTTKAAILSAKGHPSHLSRPHSSTVTPQRQRKSSTATEAPLPNSEPQRPTNEETSNTLGTTTLESTSIRKEPPATAPLLNTSLSAGSPNTASHFTSSSSSSGFPAIFPEHFPPVLLQHITAARQQQRSSSRIRFRLQPQQLGTVDIAITITHNTVSLRITVERAKAKEKLEKGIPLLREALSSHRLSLEQVNFQVATEGQMFTLEHSLQQNSGNSGNERYEFQHEYLDMLATLRSLSQQVDQQI